MSTLHVVVDHIPSSGHSDAIFALIGALGGAVVVGLLGLLSQRFQSGRDNERLERQMEHDLYQRDFEFLRHLLGDAAEALGSVRKAYIRLTPFWRPRVGEPEPRRKEAEAEQREATTAARRVLDRLRLQLPPDDPIMAEYNNALLTMDDMAALYISVGQGKPENGQLKEFGDTLGAQMEEFAGLARARVGPRSAAARADPPRSQVSAGDGEMD